MLVLALALAAPALAEHPAIERAENAVESKNVDVARDIAPLLDALKRSKDTDEKRELVDTIADLGDKDGESPNSVKEYLAKNAPPILLEVIKTGNNAFLQGDAVHALRGMNVPRSVLEQAAAIAEADKDSYVQSRGEILRNYILSMPAEDTATASSRRSREEGDRNRLPRQARHHHLARLAARGRRARRRGRGQGAARRRRGPGRGRHGRLADAALFRDGAGLPRPGLRDRLAGADGEPAGHRRRRRLAHRRQQEHSAHARGAVLRAQGHRRAGRRRRQGRRTNGSGVSPLTMALIMSNFDAAEALVAKGAKLAKSDATMVSGVTDPRGKAIIQKAMAG